MAVEALKARRSIRNFDPTYEIPEEQMNTIVECALNSPTGLNKQDLDLTIITNKEIINKIGFTVYNLLKDEVKERYTTRQKRYLTKNPITYDCSAIFMITKNERAIGNQAYESGMMAMSIMTVAQTFGLGSVPLGIILRHEVEEIVGLEKGSLVLAIAVGKPKCIDVDEKKIIMKVNYIK